MPHQPVKILRLGELLLDAGVISQANLDAALREQKDSHLRLGEILIKDGYLTENNLAEALCSQLDLLFVSLATVRPQQEALATVQAAWDQGIRYFDTAPFYGAGLAEERVPSGYLPSCRMKA